MTYSFFLNNIKLIWRQLKKTNDKYINTTKPFSLNVNIRMYNFDDVQCTVIPSAVYGFATGIHLQLCLSHGHGEVVDQQ